MNCCVGACRQLEEDQKKLEAWRVQQAMAAAGTGDIGGEGGGGSGKGGKKKKKGKAAADEFETFIDDGLPQRLPKNQGERVSNGVDPSSLVCMLVKRGPKGRAGPGSRR
jgi:hypothetical protein